MDTRLKGALPRNHVFENIVQGMEEGVMFIDDQGVVVLSNPALLEILGIEPENLHEGQWVRLIFTPEKNVEFRDLFLGVIQDHLCFSNRAVTYVTPAGETKQLTITANSLIDDSPDSPVPRGILIMINDITEIMILMEGTWQLYQERAESLDRLARAVAHEIRNPTTAIGGLANRLLSEGRKDTHWKQYLEGILASTRKLEAVVREVRNYAELSLPHSRTVNVVSWLKGLLNEYEERIAGQGVNLQWDLAVDQDKPFNAEFDPELIARVVRVLIDNALDAMADGGRLTVKLSQDSYKFTLKVQDTGGGLPPADLPFIFDPFFTTKAMGIGMNLAIANTVVRMHRGELKAENTPSGGAVFSLHLPLKSVHNSLLQQYPVDRIFPAPNA